VHHLEYGHVLEQLIARPEFRNSAAFVSLLVTEIFWASNSGLEASQREGRRCSKCDTEVLAVVRNSPDRTTFGATTLMGCPGHIKLRCEDTYRGVDIWSRRILGTIPLLIWIDLNWSALPMDKLQIHFSQT